jgi:acyl carrier protein
MLVYILDPYLNPVPVGVPGELHIAGPGVGRGYLNRPDLTAEKFVSNPFPSSNSTRGDPNNGEDKMGGRLYKSGDLARYLPNGIIEFIGRSDCQVKLHGFRIELGEVECVLGRHPKVSDTVVIAREDTPGDKRLVAYVVASHESIPTFSELRSFLKQKLPDYMIPTALVFLDLLPLTPNGKVDRRALPVPGAQRPDMEESFAAPRNAVEEALAEIWGEILRIEKVGIKDNFFELGGHSLMATRIISRLSNDFQVAVPLRQLFLYPTIAELALFIAGKLEKTERETVKQLLDEFEDLSDEEAEQLLARELHQNENSNR